MSLSRVFIVEDHPLVLSGIANLIGTAPDLVFSGSATSSEDALVLIEASQPEVVVIDLSLPGMSGISLVEYLHVQCPSLKMIVLTACEEPGFVRQSLANGARGYVTKRSVAAELLQAIRAVLAGGSYVEPRIAAQMIVPENWNGACHGNHLSHRELAVLKLVAQGYGNKEVSARLHVSVKTVETYRVRAIEKLELKTRSALVRYAHSNGWLAELH